MTESQRAQTRGFLFADLRDYTRFVEAHGDHAAADLLAAYRALVRESIAQFEGAEIRTEGDSFYVVFPSASAAVRGGLAIADAATTATADQPGRPIRVGIGVHAGESVETQEGYVGSAVNIAARIAAIAGPGQVLVSDTVRALTRTFLGVGFQAMGSRTLKGVAEPVAIYRVVPAGEAGAVGGGIASHRASRATLAAGVVLIIIAGLIGATVLSLRGSAPPTAQPPTPAPATAPIIAIATPSPAATLMAATPTLSASIADTPRPTANASVGLGRFPTTAEADLLSRLPSAFANRCARNTLDPLTGSAASLMCTLLPGSGADTVRWDRLVSPSTATTILNRLEADHSLAGGSCATSPNAWQQWAIPKAFLDGIELCYVDNNGAAWMDWTYEAPGVIARATRTDGNSASLYRWYVDVRRFFSP